MPFRDGNSTTYLSFSLASLAAKKKEKEFLIRDLARVLAILDTSLDARPLRRHTHATHLNSGFKHAVPGCGGKAHLAIF